MADQIIDSKFRVLEELPKVAGRQRAVVSDLISGHMAVLESVVIDGFERMHKRWTQQSLPQLLTSLHGLCPACRISLVAARHLELGHREREVARRVAEREPLDPDRRLRSRVAHGP